jgi:hypothetical protein
MAAIISVQVAELTPDPGFEVVVNRFNSRIGMSSFVLGTKGGKPAVLVDHVDSLLYAVDERGSGVRDALWRQGYREETFFDKGHADQVVIRDRTLVKERKVSVPEAFRATGATFANVMGKDTRALVYIDEHNRLRIHSGNDELWRSSSVVGGGTAPKIEVYRMIERSGRSFFYQLEPTPLAVDLDGDGIEEVVVPQNQVDGMLAVIFRGPSGLRLQQVNSGFEGGIVALGVIPPEDGGPPVLVAGVLRHKNFLKKGGETQIIMTAPD